MMSGIMTTTFPSGSKPVSQNRPPGEGSIGMTAFRALAMPASMSILTAATGCGPSLATLNQTASTGAINERAPVVAHAQIEIAVSPAKVWALLVNAPAWPQWNEAISQASATQPLGPGTRFTWSQGTSTIHSQVQLFEPERRLVWTGTAFTAKAIHAWELTQLPGGHTRVAISESMDGPLMAQLFSSQKLAESSNAWLAALKQAAEQP